MLDRLTRWRATWEDARESMSRGEKGCGCLFIAMLGVGGCPFAGGAMLGDYIGPTEGAVADARFKEIVILGALVWFVLCAAAGSWLTGARRRR